jgi:hypothetical protein
MRTIILLFPAYVFKSQRLVRHMNISEFSGDSFCTTEKQTSVLCWIGPTTFHSLFRRPNSFSDAPKYIERTHDT